MDFTGDEQFPGPGAEAAQGSGGGGEGGGSGSESLTFLRYFDTLFLIDDSSHMKKQWQDVSQLIQAITPICLKYDENGVDVYFVNHTPRFYFPGMNVHKSGYNNIGRLHSEPGKRNDSVASIFGEVKPTGRCKLGARLQRLVAAYIGQLKQDAERAPLNIIIITAGITDDDYQSVIVSAAKELDALHAPAHQLGIQLFQIGDDPAVRKAFEEADDELHKKAGTRDIVDTMTWSGWPGNLTPDDMVKVVLGAVSKRLDQRKKDFGDDAMKTPKKSAFDDDDDE